MNRFKNAKFEGGEAVRQAQTELLREHLLYARKFSPAYGRILSGIDAENFELNGLCTLPFTEKKDIERNPESFLAVSREKIADIVLSSGTMGKPLQIFFTSKDLERLAYNEEQSFEACGISPQDVVLLTCTMDRCFIAGLAYFLGLRARGAAVIRNGHGSIESHAEILKTIKPTAIIGVPSFIRKLGLAMQSKGQNPARAGVGKIVCIGEPLRNKNFEMLGTARDIENIWNAKVFSTYASSETAASFCECSAQRGGHLLPELAVIEIIDDHGNVLPDGETGEIVLTPLGSEAMPLVRYKTGDISFLESKPCSCGRFSARLGPILGRKQQLMKVKGTSLYPQAVFSALDEMDGVGHSFVEVTAGGELSDHLIVHVSLQGSFTKEKLAEILAARLRVTPEIIVESDEAVKRRIFNPDSRKPQRFFDRRTHYVQS